MRFLSIESSPDKTFWKIIGITIMNPINIVSNDPLSVNSKIRIKVATGIALITEINGDKSERTNLSLCAANASADPIRIPITSPSNTRKSDSSIALYRSADVSRLHSAVNVAKGVGKRYAFCGYIRAIRDADNHHTQIQNTNIEIKDSMVLSDLFRIVEIVIREITSDNRCAEDVV